MAGLRVLGVNVNSHDFTHYAGTLGIHTADGDTVTVVSMTAGGRPTTDRAGGFTDG